MLHLSPETEALIEAKARAEGTTPDELLRKVFQTEGPKQVAGKPDVERMRAIARRTASLPLLDSRSEKEITEEGWGL